uniref:Chlorosome envelope protein X n=1 Tax=Chlorobium chlorochromatii (strain CaD3) TaxID=340177 RepID=Q3APE6_CHLCH
MKITINNNSYEASVGQRILDVARVHHEHIGYFCGGNGMCQTCYITVLEGMENLTPLSREEKALLSDTLISENTRMACQTYLEKEGTIRIKSFVEDVKDMFEQNPTALVGYAGKMGWEALVKFPDTITLQSQREWHLMQFISDVLNGIGDAFLMVSKACGKKV